MAYKINMPGMFAVPNSIADEHLKLAKELHLKVLLWMLRRGGEVEGLEALAGWLGKPVGDLVDALQFWIDRNVIAVTDPEDAENPTPAAQQKPPPLAAAAAAAPPAVSLMPALPPARPAASQIITRTNEDSNLRELFRIADTMLGRTIGYEGQCVLLLLHDTYGLPVEVIPMLLQYCAKAGKTNNGYIEAMGRDWGTREIDTIEKADEQIAALTENLSLWNQLRHMAGLHAPRPTAVQCDYMRRWQREFGYGIDMIFAAYEEMANHTGKLSFSYMNKVLEGWHSQGLKTPEQTAAAKASFQRKTAAKAKSASPAEAPASKPSYDLEEYERNSLVVPVFKKD